MNRKQNKSFVLKIKEEASVQNAEELKITLLEALKNNKSVTVDNSSIVEPDLTYLQLLVSGKLYSDNADVVFNIKNNSEVLTKLMAHTGLSAQILYEM